MTFPLPVVFLHVLKPTIPSFKQLKLLFVNKPVILPLLLSVVLGSDCSRGRFGVGDSQDFEVEHVPYYIVSIIRLVDGM